MPMLMTQTCQCCSDSDSEEGDQAVEDAGVGGDVDQAAGDAGGRDETVGDAGGRDEVREARPRSRGKRMTKEQRTFEAKKELYKRAY